MMTQQYEKYTLEDQKVWQLLYERQMAQLPGLASPAFLQGLKDIHFTAEKIPDFIEVNVLLGKITGWNLAVVDGLIPNKEFFELLKDKKFPASTWLRKLKELDYLEEPDMFHDVFGHVPLLANHNFCGFLQGLSKVALQYIDNAFAIELISRVYWYTVEFGLIREASSLKIYGAGILSSSGESVYSLGPKPGRVPYNVAQIMQTPYIKDKFQEQYFVIESYEQLFNSVDEVASALEQALALAE